MIEKGDSPEKKINKFIDFDGDGHRGVLVALSKDKKSGIIIATTSTFGSQEERKKAMEKLAGHPINDYETEMNGIVVAGRFYLISETNPESYPMIVKQIYEIPEDFVILK